MQNAVSTFQSVVIGNTIRKCHLFSGLSDETLQKVAAISCVKTLTKGDFLFHEGSAVQGFFIVQQGAIKLHRVSAAGKEHVFHVFRSGEALAEEALLSDSGYPVDACATETSRVIMVRKAEFIGLLKGQPDLVIGFLRSLGQQFRLLLNLLEDLTLKDVQTRLANWLIQHCPNPDSHDPYTIELPMAKRLLASELGTVSETFSRTLAKFRKDKLLEIHGKAVTLLCPTKLNRLTQPNLGVATFEAPIPSWKNNGFRAPDADAFSRRGPQINPVARGVRTTGHLRFQEAVS